MTAEQKLPYDLHDSTDLGRFTHVTPSTLTDSEHEVLVEVNSDSDIPAPKAPKKRNPPDVLANGRKQVTDRKKKAPTNELRTELVVADDLLYHLMDQNKTLLDQNKALTRRVELLEPFPVALPRPEFPFEPVPIPMPEPPPHFNAHPCPPEPFSPEFAEPVRRKPKDPKDDKIYAQSKELWDALGRLLRVLEAAAPPPSADSAIVNSRPWETYECVDMFDSMPIPHCYVPPDPTASHEEIMLAISKDTVMSRLNDAERKFGINQKSKKYGKKGKPKTETGRFTLFDTADLPPWAWRALGFLQTFLLVFVMIQLSLVGGGVFSFFQKSPKDSSWLNF